MPKVKYLDKSFQNSSLELVRVCNSIIADYMRQGFTLTLRQLYYQLVTRNLIRNKQKEYKRLGSIVNDARLAGLIDWHAIEDRTRNLRSMAHWKSPSEIIQACSRAFQLDMWDGQEYRPEVWIEKDALVGVIEGVCNELDVPFFSCRGYTSQSEMWGAAQRLSRYQEEGQTPVIFHFGDHDPSGRDMTRDISDRLSLFMGGCKVKRLALNMDQVEQYRPPPNPAKTTDTRYQSYIIEFGHESWELDALNPTVIAALIRQEIMSLVDQDQWEKQSKESADHRALLVAVAERWGKVVTVIAKDLLRKTLKRKKQ